MSAHTLYQCSKCNIKYPPYSFDKKCLVQNDEPICFKCEGKETLQCSECRAVLPKISGGFSKVERTSNKPRCTICCNHNKQNRKRWDDDDHEEYSGEYIGHGEWDTPSGFEEGYSSN